MSSVAYALQAPPSESVVCIRPLAEHRRTARLPLLLVPERRDEPAPTPPHEAEVRRLLTGVLEVLDGRRSRTQLVGVVPCRYERALAGEISPGRRSLKSLHFSRTAPSIIDLCARYEYGARSRAMTGRLELRADRWEFTVLALV